MPENTVLKEKIKTKRRRENYKRIGDYIQRVEVRNTDLKVTNLLGLSMAKEFRPTTSNIVGTDLSVYRVMKKFQFACDFMSPIRVSKLPVVLKLDDDPNLVSPAYPVFEIIDRSLLLPEYLMMWFRRPEFDRYATFKCDAAIRGGYGWEELCDTLIPVPPIEKQREIVEEYKVVEDRIELNNRMIQKLEETAQAIYKHWFVDFEFPDENGKPYKSSGGEMVESELGEIPKGWEVTDIKSMGNVVTGKTPSSDCPEDFGDKMPFITPGDFNNYHKFALGATRNLSQAGYFKLKNKILPPGSVIVTCIGSDMGKISVSTTRSITNQQMNSIVVKESFYSDFLYYYLLSIAEEIKGIAIGGSTMPMLSKSDFEKLKIINPRNDLLTRFQRVMKPVNEINITYSKENQKLAQLKTLLLSKLAK